MREFVGKAAFVTGGASGIGLALGRAFAEAGCKVMLADIEKAALDVAVASLSGPEIRALSAMSPIPLPSTPLLKQPFSVRQCPHSVQQRRGWCSGRHRPYRARQLAVGSGCQSDGRGQRRARLPAAYKSAWRE